MSNFISSISPAGLREMPPVSKHQRLHRLRRAVVAQHDQLRRLVGAVRHREQSAHAELLHVGPFQYREAELELARELFRLVGEVGRRADVRRQIAERLRQIGAVGDRPCLGQRLRERRLGAERQHHAFERGGWRGGLLLRLQLVETIERVAQAEHRMAHVPGERLRRHFRLDEEQRRVLRAELAQRRCCAAHRVAELRRTEILARAERDEQHALGGDAGQAAQQQRRAGLCRKVCKRLAQRAARRLIDAPRGRRQLLALLLVGVHADHDAARLRGLGRERRYAKFHRESIA
jgi:hypothetical protein